MRNLNRFIFGFVVALTLAGCGGTTARPDPARAAALTNADALATEALAVYQLQRDGARSWNLISAATQQAPRRTDLAYLQMRLCALIEGCRPEPYETRLRQLDPDNAVVWMRALADAQRRREAIVEAQIVDAIGRAKHFDVYWNALGARIANTRMANGTRPDSALGDTISWMGDTLVPSLQPLTVACSRSRTTDAAWAERCSRAARVLMNGDTYIAESVGTKLAQQVASDTATQMQLSERDTDARYLWRTYAAITSAQIERDKYATEIVDLMSKLRREQDVHMAVARWARRPVKAPPGWTDED